MKMIKTLILVFSICSGIVSAQVVNIENRRVSDGTYGFSGALDMTLSAQKQKDMLITVHFKPLIQYKFSGKSDLKYKKAAENGDSTTMNQSDSLIKADKNKHLLLLINDLKYTGARKNTYANFGMSHLRYAYRIGNSGWKWESYTQIQYNQLLLQKVRTLIGSGFRLKLTDVQPREGGYDKRAVRMFAGTSLFYEYEEINYSFRPMEYINSVRWSTYLSSYFNFRHFEFISTTYVQPNLATFKDYRVAGDYALLLRISEPFSVKLNYSHFFDSRPPETVTDNTFSFSAGFVYKLDKFHIDQMKRKKREKRERVKEEF
ncbi:DUF481 domain-containing protein [Fluviicola sp. SGL-29]|nr:DUF481 domain-containing protein [Fluviicola sp. SGL-29]